MKIQVLGSGCKSCKSLFERTEQLVTELGIDATVEYVNDIQQVVAMGVMSVPVLAIDGRPVSVGVVPEKEELVKLLTGQQSNNTSVAKTENGCPCKSTSTDESRSEKKQCCGEKKLSCNPTNCPCKK